MASAGTSAAALLFSFSAVVLLLIHQAAPSGLADLLVSALDRFLDGRRLLELATRRNMILLCHAILLVILRDAGVLGSPASRRNRSPPSEATATAARAHATRSAVVWRRRRPRNRAAAPMHDAAAAHRLVECQPVAEAAAASTSTWAAPLVTTAAEEAAAVATEQIVLAESPRNDDDDLLDQQLEHPTAIVSDGQTDRYHCDDRRIIAVAADDDDTTAREQQTAGMEMELADDRTFDEFIESQRRQMRQEESLQLLRSAYHYQAITTCY